MGLLTDNILKRIISSFCAACILIAGVPAISLIRTFAAEAEGPQNTDEYDQLSYSGYIAKNGPVIYGQADIVLSGDHVSAESKDIAILPDFQGRSNVIKTTEASELIFSFSILESGYYSIMLDYYALKGNNQSIERKIYVDDQIPFSESRSIVFSRAFVDDGAITADQTGNETRPSQIETFKWQESYFTDTMGYYNDRLYYYLAEGDHSLKMLSIREPMAIEKLILSNRGSNNISYAEYLDNAKDLGAKEVHGISGSGYIEFEAEKASEKSDQTLYPLNDRSSPATTPYHYSKVRMNYIGGSKWKFNGQRISWEIDVPETGLYNLALRSRQSFVRGMYVTRRLYIDGKTPFEEAKNLQFYYSDDWKLDNLKNQDDFLFYLEKGKRTIALEVTLGDLASIISSVQDTMNILSNTYWDLTTIMGLKPDVNRDYHIGTIMPQVIETFKKQSVILNDLAKKFEEKTRQTDSYTVALVQLARQMERMVKKESLIAPNLSKFSDNIGALANWISLSNEQPLQIDKIILSQPSAVLPKAEKGFFNKVVHEIKMLASTFFDDYSLIATSQTSGYKTVKVWIGNGITGGRDQVQVLKNLIVNDFSPKNEININLQLISAGTLVAATLAGKGPDVSLQTSGSDPVNYAMRGAVYDLTNFSDYKTVSLRFLDSTLVPYTYLDGVYALPETQSHFMMFYRKDILNRMGIDAQKLQTWQDIINIIPDLQNKHLTFGLPVSMSTYAMFLYQMGGEFYRDNGKKSNFDQKANLEAFKLWTEFYTNYMLPIEYNFENRFRFGSMPIGISDYTTYNILSISAPEIKGLWGIMPVPGIRGSDEKINNTVAVGGAGTILMKSSKVKEQAWEFMKWWTSKDIQVAFGYELESVLGQAARYNTANYEAIEQMPWSANDKRVLLEQYVNSKGIPEVPGGYYTSRYLDFSIRDVTNSNLEPRSVMLSYVGFIDDEIETKRLEFGLK